MYHEIARMFAAYNAWCNSRLYSAAESLGEPRLREQRGVYFGSMIGTLNHLLVADRIWMRRFTGSGDAPTRLDEILHDNLADLGAARTAEDARIVGWMDGLSERDLASTFTYRTISNPADVVQTLAPMLAHFFNHQTHHRGQAHAILTGFGENAPSFDLIVFQRETGIGLGEA